MSYHCYLLQGEKNHWYVGCTNRLHHRLRQHNGELVGGAKKTSRWRPWKFRMVIEGFSDRHQCLRFEFRLQKALKNTRVEKKVFAKVDQLLSQSEGRDHRYQPWYYRHILLFDD